CLRCGVLPGALRALCRVAHLYPRQPQEPRRLAGAHAGVPDHRRIGTAAGGDLRLHIVQPGTAERNLRTGAHRERRDRPRPLRIAAARSYPTPILFLSALIPGGVTEAGLGETLLQPLDIGGAAEGQARDV